MAAAIAGVAAQSNVGASIVPTGSGFATTHAITVTVSGPNTSQSDIKVTGTTSDGAFDPKLTIVPNAPGDITITFNDGTTTVVAICEVWHAG